MDRFDQLSPWTTKSVLSCWGIFVAITKNILHGSKLSIFFYAKNHEVKIMIHEDI